MDRVLLLSQKATFLATMGRPDQALDCAEEAVAAANDTGSTCSRGIADSALGYALAEVDPERAILHLERSRSSRQTTGELFDAIGDRRLARLRVAAGDLPAALTLYAEQLEAWIPELDHLALMLTCESLAVDLSRTDHDDIAAVLFGALDAPAEDYQGNPSVGRAAAVAELRARLGDDRYQTLADRGRAMSPAEMLDYARTETDRLLAEQADR